MARSQHESGSQHVSLVNITAEQWAEAAAEAGYAVNNGEPLFGISGDEGDGYIVPVPVPTNIDPANLFRALAAYSLRVGQAAVKAAKEPSREVAVEGVAKALNGGYKPGRDRSNDILDKESDRMFADHVRARVLAAKPDASEKDIAATVEKLYDTDNGKKLRSGFRNEIVSRGTYTPTRKGGKAAGAVEIDLL